MSKDKNFKKQDPKIKRAEWIAIEDLVKADKADASIPWEPFTSKVVKMKNGNSHKVQSNTITYARSFAEGRYLTCAQYERDIRSIIVWFNAATRASPCRASPNFSTLCHP